MPEPDPESGGDSTVYTYVPLSGEYVVADSVANSVDPFTGVSAVEAGDSTYAKFTYQYWAIDTALTAPAYTGAELLALEAAGVISDSTTLCDPEFAYGYTAAAAGLSAVQVRAYAAASPPPPPPKRPPAQPSQGDLRCKRISWGELKTKYVD